MGSPEFVFDFVKGSVDEAVRLRALLASLLLDRDAVGGESSGIFAPDTFDTVLRYCIAPRVTHLLRTLPPGVAASEFSRFHSMTCSTTTLMSHLPRSRLRLPVIFSSLPLTLMSAVSPPFPSRLAAAVSPHPTGLTPRVAPPTPCPPPRLIMTPHFMGPGLLVGALCAHGAPSSPPTCPVTTRLRPSPSKHSSSPRGRASIPPSPPSATTPVSLNCLITSHSPLFLTRS